MAAYGEIPMAAVTGDASRVRIGSLTRARWARARPASTCAWRGDLQELPKIRAAFERGELSYSQVRALSRVATPELEGRLLELARRSTAAQLERVLRAYRGVLARELRRRDRAW